MDEEKAELINIIIEYPDIADKLLEIVKQPGWQDAYSKE